MRTFVLFCALSTALSAAEPGNKKDVTGERPRIGVKVGKVDPELAKETKCPVTEGAVVTSCRVYDPHLGRPLLDCFAGDVITRIATTSITGPDDFNEWFAQARQGRTYKLKFYRQIRAGQWAQKTLTFKFTEDEEGREDLWPYDSLYEGERRLPNVCVRVPSSVKLWSVGGGELRMEVDSLIVYIGNRIQPQYFWFVQNWFRPSDGEAQVAKDGFYRVNGKAEEITFDSDNSNIFEASQDDTGPFVRFKEAGTANLIVHFMGESFPIPIEVVRLPFDVDDETKAVIKALGFADGEKTYTCSWPDRRVFDNIRYAPDELTGEVVAKHWSYDKYPFLAISIVNGRVYGVGSSKHPDLTEREKWARGEDTRR